MSTLHLRRNSVRLFRVAKVFMPCGLRNVDPAPFSLNRSGQPLDVLGFLDEHQIVENLASRGKALVASQATDLIFQEIFYNQNIVVEESPPQLIDLISAMRSGSGTIVGAFTGFIVAHDASAPILLLLTVPSGILICASAMGLAKGIEQALKKTVYRWITKRKWNAAMDGARPSRKS